MLKQDFNLRQSLCIMHTPGAPLTYFNDGGVRQRFIFYTPKNPNFRICLPQKIPTIFSIPKKIPQCFCISKFYYLSSGKLKHANFNFCFGQKQNYKLRLCYFLFELMKNTIPKKIPLLFLRPNKIPGVFHRPKKIPFGQNVRPKKILRTPLSLKYVSGAPGMHTLEGNVKWQVIDLFMVFFNFRHGQVRDNLLTPLEKVPLYN